MSVDHYENFPVASWLCPPHLRPAVVAIYHFARTADDLADEGHASTAERVEALAHYRRALTSAHRGQVLPNQWAAVFTPLSAAVRRHDLPLAPLNALIDAFEQDLRQTRWPDRESLLDYASKSANPVGRLLLHLYGVNDPKALAESDAICTALQFINFWQDFSRDLPRDRVYAPESDLRAHGLSDKALLAQVDSAPTQALVLSLSDWSRRLMSQGAPLVHRLPGRMGWELRLVVQGGLRVLDKIEAQQGRVLRHRPSIRASDYLHLVWRATRMTRSSSWENSPAP